MLYLKLKISCDLLGTYWLLLERNLRVKNGNFLF